MRLRLFSKTFLLWLGPNVFVFIGQSNKVPKWITENIIPLKSLDPDVLKDWCTFIGLAFTGFLLPYTLSSLKELNKKQEVALQEILFSWKESLAQVFREAIRRPNYVLNIRIFVKKKWYQFHISDWYDVIKGNKIEFTLINLPNLSEQDNTSGISFEVKPVSQGVVGIIYNNDAVITDNQVGQNRGNYHLNNFQLQRVSHINFVMGGPVYDSASKIIGIITFDSREAIDRLNQDQQQKFIQIVVKYSDLIHKYLPLLTPKNQ